MSTTDTAAPADELRRDMAQAHVAPLWELEAESMGIVPRPHTRAWLWRWRDLNDVAERGGDRRAVALGNPGQGGLPYATSTLWAAVQWRNGHDVAPAHRHTSQAIRFIIAGTERGDLVLMPPWHWHDHDNASGERAIWMDVLDIPLTNVLDASFFEPHTPDSQEITQQLEGSVLKWADTERALANLAQVDADPFDDVALEYTDPHTGGPVMRSFSCRIQQLRPGVHTRAHRHTGSAVYLAFEGRGATIIDGVRFAWEQGDMFTIPSWAVHEHLNEDPDARAVLFSAHDTPLLQALDKFRVEPYACNGGRQEIVGEFMPVSGAD